MKNKKTAQEGKLVLVQEGNFPGYQLKCKCLQELSHTGIPFYTLSLMTCLLISFVAHWHSFLDHIPLHTQANPKNAMPYQTSQSRNKCVFMHIDDK